MRNLSLLLGIVFVGIGMIVMLQSAGTMSEAIGVLFAVFGAIINLLQLYTSMPLFSSKQSSSPSSQNQANHPRSNLFQTFSQYLAAQPFTSLSKTSSSAANKIFLWICLIIIPIISVTEIGVHGGISIPTAISVLAMSVVGLIFLISNLFAKKHPWLDMCGNILFVIVAEAIFLSLSLSYPWAFFSTEITYYPPIQYTPQYFGYLIFFISTLEFIIGNIFLSRHLKAAPGAIYGAIFIMGGLSLSLFGGVSFLSLWISFLDMGSGATVFLATRGK